jgi:hypothetical protein
MNPTALTNSVASEPESSSACSLETATGPYPEPGEPTVHPPPDPQTNLSSILIPSSHLRLDLPSGLFLSGFSAKTLYNFLPSPMRATCLAPLILLDLIYLMGCRDEYKLWSSPLGNFLHSPVTSSLLGPNIPLSTLFSNTLRLCNFLNVTDKVSHPYKTTGRIVVFMF